MWTVSGEPRPDAGARLYCFPHAGGSPAEYVRWGPAAPRSLEVNAMILPGRASRIREPAHDTMESLIGALIAEFRPQAPYAVFGHSLGALVAFEFARAAARAGLPSPLALFVSSHPAPTVPRAVDPITALDDDGFVEAVSSRHGAVPDEVLENGDLLALVLPYLRADYRIVERYRPLGDDPIETDIVACVGLDDRIPRADITEWRQQTAGGFELLRFPGGHFYVSEQSDALMGAIASRLERHI